MARPRDHHSTFARRDQRARAEGFSSYRDKRRHGGANAAVVRNQGELDRLPGAARAQRRQSLRALAEAREGIPLAEAARRHDTTLDAVLFWSAGAVMTDGVVAKTDRLWRPMRAISASTHSVVDVDVRGSAAASRLSSYWLAVETYLNSGDDTTLRAFVGVRVAGVELETDTDVIDHLAVLGELSFETIYQEVAA